jgi:hypothetical protein
VGFVVDKAALGQFFSEYFGFPCQSFHRFLHYHNHPGLTQEANKWPQCRVDLDSLLAVVYVVEYSFHTYKNVKLLGAGPFFRNLQLLRQVVNNFATFTKLQVYYFNVVVI